MIFVGSKVFTHARYWQIDLLRTGGVNWRSAIDALHDFFFCGGIREFVGGGPPPVATPLHHRGIIVKLSSYKKTKGHPHQQEETQGDWNFHSGGPDTSNPEPAENNSGYEESVVCLVFRWQDHFTSPSNRRKNSKENHNKWRGLNCI